MQPSETAEPLLPDGKNGIPTSPTKVHPKEGMVAIHPANGGASDAKLSRAATIRLLVFGGLLSFSSIFQMGYSNAYPNTAIESFRGYLNESFHGSLAPSQFTWLWSSILNVWFIGFAIGSWIAVPIADRIGRKYCLLIGNAVNVISAVLQFAAIPLGFWWLYMGGRLLFAIAAAISMNSLILLLQESSPPSLRGTMSFYAEMAFVMTNGVGILFGMRMVLGAYLEWLTGLAIIPALASFLIVLPFHESPKYLLLKRGDRPAAEAALRFYQSTPPADSVSILDDVAKEGESNAGGAAKLSDLWTVPHLRKGLLLGIASLQITTSLWPVVYLSTELLVRAKVDPESAEHVTMTMLVFSTFSTILGMAVVERISRRRLFLSFCLVNIGALALFVVSACSQHIQDEAKYGCVLAVILHGVSYSIAVGPIAWFITAELLPLSHRAAAQSIALSINQVAALSLSFLTLPAYDLIESFGWSGSLIILPFFVIPGLICIGILYKNLPETRGVEITDVIKALQGGYVSAPKKLRIKSSASEKLEEVEL